MTIKNESALGLKEFLPKFYQDCLKGVANGWWNESYGRRHERVNIIHNNVKYVTLYELVEGVKKSTEDFSNTAIEQIVNDISKSFPAINLKRVYRWEVDTSVEKQEEPVQEEKVVEDTTEQEVQEEVESKPEPDFEYAKKIEDKQELKAYAKEFGFKLDSRKALSDMMKSFQGKFHATKNK